jgi:altronate dehydratase
MDDQKLTAILISPRDNVATVTKDTLPGETVTYLRNGMTETIVSAGVPKYHKIALCEIPKGADIYKYGEIMGLRRAGHSGWGACALPQCDERGEGMKFYGFQAPDGTVGIRNHVLIMATVGCAAETAVSSRKTSTARCPS